MVFGSPVRTAVKLWSAARGPLTVAVSVGVVVAVSVWVGGVVAEAVAVSLAVADGVVETVAEAVGEVAVAEGEAVVVAGVVAVVVADAVTVAVTEAVAAGVEVLSLPQAIAIVDAKAARSESTTQYRVRLIFRCVLLPELLSVLTLRARFYNRTLARAVEIG
jgi:hypothetical protein